MKSLHLTNIYTYRLSAEGRAIVLEQFRNSGLSGFEIEKALNLREGQFKKWLAGEIGLSSCFINRIGEILKFQISERKNITVLEQAA